MNDEVSFGSKMLVGFLRFMVIVLVIILIAIPVCILLDILGLL
ncbi:hypothetical protein [Flagellimonas allohymeniacidonis]|nr:hypothetical protein [Allomuricauda hymeniacidonis]